MLASAVKIASVGAWEYDVVKDRIDWADETLRIFGTTRAAFGGRLEDFWDFVHPEDRFLVRKLESQTGSVGGRIAMEFRIVRPDGAVRTLYDEGQVVYDEAGQALRSAGMAMDITDRKRSQERIEEQAALIDEARDAIVVRDLRHRIVSWNKGAERVYGWSSADALGDTLHTLLGLDPKIFEGIEAALLQQEAWNGEIEVPNKAGKIITLDCRWTLLRDAQGIPKSILSIDSDVTERKKLEQQSYRAQRLDSIGTLAGGIAHDLNNILAPITLGAGLLKHYEMGNKSLRIVKRIESSARRGTDLVQQVLTFARGEQGAKVPGGSAYRRGRSRSHRSQHFPEEHRFRIGPAGGP